MIQEGDSLSRFGFSAKIIHLPGHTSGSIGVLTDTGELICGDVYANIKKPVPAPNAFDFKQLKSSISRLKSYNITEIYPGHGEPFRSSEIRL
jgi:glyoxylase-like metal-dependent hydrolase (beta-lactamase superfamily II)